MNIDFLRPDLDRWQRAALIGGAALLVLGGFGAFLNPTQFFRSYLIAFLLCLGLSLGCLALLMLNHLVQGNWGFVIQRFLEAAVRTLPLMLVLVLPLLLGVRHLYVWSNPEYVQAHEVVQQKTFYLNAGFWVARAFIYFAIWLTLGYFLTKWSREQDATGDRLLTGRLKRLSGPGLILYGLSITFAVVDWVMSLQPEWFSTIFGMIFITGQVLSALCFCVLIARWVATKEPVHGIFSSTYFHDLGNLMLAFVMLWAYTSFSQLLITWAGNLPEEIPWYVRRFNMGWAWTALFLIVFHFAVPFLFLLMRPIKRDPGRLAQLASALLLMRFLDIFWMVEPVFHDNFSLHWMDLVLPLGMAGLWLSWFVWQLKSAPLFPVNDPRAASVLAATPAHGH